MRFGDGVRLEVAATMPADMVSYLTQSLGLSTEDVYVITVLLMIRGRSMRL